MSGPAPLLSIVVLSYDRPAYLRQALASLVAQSAANCEIIVVDNPSASSPEIASVVAAFPDIRLLSLPANRGFTGGMSAGIAGARGRHVLLTEDDIVMEPGCLAALLKEAGGAGAPAVLTGIMLDQGTRRIRCAGGEIALGPPFRMQVIGAGEDVGGARTTPYEVSFAPGAFLFFPAGTLSALGGFRDDYFMYLEDVELCLRARRLDIEIRVVPGARVGHLPPAPGPASPALEFHKIKNLLATYLLHAPLLALPSVVVRYVALEGVRRARAGRAQLAAFLRAAAWVLVHAPRLLRDRGRARP